MKWRPGTNLITLTATVVVCAALYAAAAARYSDLGFFTLQVFLDFFRDNAYLGIAAVGMTFVILSGGIDLSVGAVVGLTGILLATLMESRGWHPAMAVPVVLLVGAALGLFQGFLIHTFQLAPFFVTLAGMFFARGVALLISTESIGLQNELFLQISDLRFLLTWRAALVYICAFIAAAALLELIFSRSRLYAFATAVALAIAAMDLYLLRNTQLLATGYEQVALPFVTVLFLIVTLIGIYLARWTRFGRFTYAIGGNEQSALLMGLPVAWTKMKIYGFSGLCSAIAGVAWSMQFWSGKATAAEGMELDAIAAVVLGGTLLSGGVGSVLGSVIGVLILAIILQVVILENVNTWWTRIVIGALLLAFIVMQKLLTRLGAVRRD